MAAVAVASPLKEMYQLKPIYQEDVIDLPKCMYGMKSLHAKEPKDMDSDMKALGEKERKIAADLESLTEEIKTLSNRLGHKFGEVPSISDEVKLHATATVKIPDGVSDFVISMSPKKMSLSALLICELFELHGTHVAMPFHIHSSLREEIPDNLVALSEGFSGRLQHNVTNIVMTFMWKDDPFCPSLMFSPLLQTRIIGDANIARYLCRLLLPHLYDESIIEDIAFVDKWIDMSVQMACGSSKEKDAVMKSMNSHLGRNEYFCQQKLSLADITLLASLLTNMESFKSLPKNVKKWYSVMSNCFFKTVTKFNVPESWLGQ